MQSLSLNISLLVPIKITLKLSSRSVKVCAHHMASYLCCGKWRNFKIRKNQLVSNSVHVFEERESKLFLRYSECKGDAKVALLQCGQARMLN